MIETLLVLVAAFAAGFLDASVGGGGMVLLPTLFAVFPTTPHPVLMGTNKLSSTFGLANSAWRYTRSLAMPWNVALPAAAGYFLLAIAGAALARMVPTAVFRLLVPFMLTGMLIYVLTRRDFGRTHLPRVVDRGARWVAFGVGAVLGLYEGFFGPGAGVLLIFAFVRLFGFDFLRATAAAKVVNTAGCVGALLVFGVHGEVMWLLAAGMAVANVAGSWAGTHIAITRGSAWLRGLFIVVSALLIAKTAWDAARPWLAQ